jgi:hypothetical protein
MEIKELEKIIEKEGDYKAFEYEGYKCRVIRPFPYNKNDAHNLFHLCGYVGLPKKHKYYNKGYDDIPVEVHGGLTFSEDTLQRQPEKNLWWIGFDCAHSGDVAHFYFNPPTIREDETYKDMKYVETEIKSLVDQLTK